MYSFFFLMEPYCDQQLTSSIECALLTFILSFFVTLFALIVVLFAASWKFNLEILTKVAVVATNSVDFATQTSSTFIIRKKWLLGFVSLCVKSALKGIPLYKEHISSSLSNKMKVNGTH